jgi:transposase
MSSNSTTINFENQVFYIGIDVHKRSWCVTIRSNHMVLKTFSMLPDTKKLVKHLNQNYPGGIYKSAYEAGYCGFWIHKQLVAAGVDNIVIHAADVPTTHKEKQTKTDKVDSRKIAKELENQNLNAIYIPSDSQQQIRSLCRLRHQAVKQSTRLKNRIKRTFIFMVLNYLPAVNFLTGQQILLVIWRLLAVNITPQPNIF